MTTVFTGINGDKAVMASDTGLTTTINGKLQTLSYRGHVQPLNDNLLITTSGNAVLADSIIKELLAQRKRLNADYVADYFMEKLKNKHGQDRFSINILTRTRGSFKFIDVNGIEYKESVKEEDLEEYNLNNSYDSKTELDNLCQEAPYKKEVFTSSKEQPKYYFLKPHIPEITNKIEAAIINDKDLNIIADYAVKAVATKANNTGHTSTADIWFMKKTGIPPKKQQRR